MKIDPSGTLSRGACLAHKMCLRPNDVNCIKQLTKNSIVPVRYLIKGAIVTTGYQTEATPLANWLSTQKKEMENPKESNNPSYSEIEIICSTATNDFSCIKTAAEKNTKVTRIEKESDQTNKKQKEFQLRNKKEKRKSTSVQKRRPIRSRKKTTKEALVKLVSTFRLLLHLYFRYFCIFLFLLLFNSLMIITLSC